MPVTSLKPGYAGEIADREEHFHGQRLFYVGWDGHLMFANAFALLLPAAATFATLVKDVLPAVFGEHPDFPKIDWARATWLRDGVPFTPDFEQSLEANSIGFKSVLRFQTPGLTGIRGSGS